MYICKCIYSELVQNLLLLLPYGTIVPWLRLATWRHHPKCKSKFTPTLFQAEAKRLGKPVSKTSKIAEQYTTDNHVMEVRDKK